MIDLKPALSQTVRRKRLVITLSACGIASGCATIDTTPQLPDPLQAGWKGRPVCEALHDDASHRVLRCTFPPGVGHERHFHSAHFGYAISGGRARIEDASGVRVVDLATGSSFASDGVAWHEVLNVGDTTIIYLMVEPKAANR